jgi:energy-coupling factor transporter ATP-binding protein EcfA2
MSRIISLKAENIKRLSAISITPKGNVVTIGGKNAQGKSSILDAIAMAIGGTKEIPDVPIRNGQSKAKIILETEEIVVKRTFTKEGGGTLVIENKEGLRYTSPQEVLNKLTGKLTFDPLSFLSVSPEKQAEALRGLVGLNFTAPKSKAKLLFDERTLVNRDIERCRALAETMPFFKDAPREFVSTTDLVAEMDAAKKHNNAKFDLETKYEVSAEGLDFAKKAAEFLRVSIAEMEAKLIADKKTLKDTEQCINERTVETEAARVALAAFVSTDLKPIMEKLSGSALTNKQVQANQLRQDALNSLAQKVANSNNLTAQIDAIESDMSAQLAAAKFPVPGLSFTDAAVIFNGVPLGQASDAEKIRVAVAISAALNPKLKIMLARQGSLLDDDNLALLAKLAEEYDIQVWLEIVSTDKKKCQIIISNGEVVDAEAEAPAPVKPELFTV